MTGAVQFTVDINAAGLRFLMLQSHYRSPLNFSEQRLRSARKTLRRLVLAAEPSLDGPPDEIVSALCDDLDTPKALAQLSMFRAAGEGRKLFAGLRFLGLIGAPSMTADARPRPGEVATATNPTWLRFEGTSA